AGCLGCITFGLTVAADQPRCGTTLHQLLVVGPGASREITINRGDMLQFEPFRVPIVPRSLRAALRVTTRGDRALEWIGQTTVEPPGDQAGASRRAAFLYARQAGKTTVEIVLIDKGGTPINGYVERYRATVEAARVGQGEEH